LSRVAYTSMNFLPPILLGLLCAALLLRRQP
jgi:hypothetical protein